MATWILFVIAVLQSLFGPMDLEVYPNLIRVGVDKVVGIKLAVAAMASLAGLWGFWRFGSVRRTAMTVPAVMIMVLLALTAIGGSSRITPAAIPTSIINALNVIFVITILTVSGLRVFSMAIIVGAMATALYGLYLFYLQPARGVFTEPIEHGQFVLRIGGLAHPNSIARSIALAILLTLYLYRTKEIHWSLFTLLMIPLGWNFLLAKSRTAIVAGTFAGILLYSDRLRSRVAIGAAVLGVILGLFGLFGLFALGKEGRLVDKFVGLVSKTGESEELTSGTGRDVIWSEAAKYIAQRPLTGWGLNSGPVLLEHNSQSTHNAIMNATLSGGIVAGLIMVGLQLWLLITSFQSRNLLVRGVSMFLFTSMLTEDTVLETFPGPCTMLWYMCLLYPVLRYSPIRTVLRSRPEPIERQLIPAPTEVGG